MTVLGDVLQVSKDPVRVSDPNSAKLISVKLHGRGAVRRILGDGKAPKPFTGNRGRTGQFVFSRIWARRGAMALIPEDLDGVVVTNEFPLFDIDERRLVPRYLMYLVQTASFHKELQRVSAGASGQNRVKESAFLALPIELPDLFEQHRVAAILDQADAIRAKRRQVLAHLDALTQSIFIDMFGDPSTWHSRWRMGTIGEMAESVQYGSSAKAGASGKWPMLRMGNVTDDGRLDLADLKYVNLAERDIPKYTVMRGDLLFNRTNSKEKVGKSCVVDTDEPLAIAGYLVRVRFKPEHRSEFVCSYLSSRHGLAVRQRMAKAAVNQANINATEMRRIAIAHPPKEIQIEFAERVHALKERRDAILIARSADDELFTSLQSRAFRGEL